MIRHPHLLQPDNSVLVIVDIQTKLLNAMPALVTATLLKNTENLIKAAHLLDIPILLTEQYPKGLGATDTRITTHLNSNTRCFEKTCFSCCSAENFSDSLQQLSRQQIILVGQEAHICILQTAFDLTHQNFQVYALEDATCSRQAQHHSNALQRMQQHDITISNTESVLFEWLEDAKHPHFSAISKQLR